MAFRNIGVTLTASDAGLVSTVRRSSATVDEFGRRVDRTGRLVNTSTNGMGRGFSSLDGIISRGVNRSLTGFVAAAAGGYAAGRALNAGLQAVVGGAVQFDARMRNVNSIAHLSEAQLHSLGNEVLDLSERLPQSANTLAEGLYDIQSSGFAGTAGLIVLNQSARAATAGLTDASTSAAAVAGVLNAYGEQARDAQFVSDALFKTVDVGVLSFGDLAQGIGQVVGTAASAKVDIDQLGQAIATMTRGGIVPAEAFTSTNQLLAQIIQPGEALAGVFHQLGYESGAAALEERGLFGVMEDIRRTTGGNITTMSELFTDIRSLRGALALGTDQGRLYRDVVGSWDEAHKGAGATARAFAEQQKAVAFQWGVLKNEAQAAAISAGTEVLPMLIRLMHGVEDVGHVLANDGVQGFLLFAGGAYALNKALKIGLAVRDSTLVTVARSGTAHSAAATAINAEGTAAARTAAEVQALAIAENEAAVAAGRLAGATGAAGAGTVIGAGMGAVVPGRRAVAGSAIRALGKATVVGLAGVASYELTTAGLHGIFGDRFGADPLDPNDPNDVMRNFTTEGKQSIQTLIDQYGSLDTALKVMREMNDEATASQHKLGVSHRLTTGNIEDELAALQALQQQRDQFTQQVQAGFFGAVDVTQQFDPESGEQAVSAAQDRLLEAQRNLRQAEAVAGDRASTADQRLTDYRRQLGDATKVTTAQEQRLHDLRASASADGATVSNENTLADARRAVADATKDLNDAQADAARTGDLATIYRSNIAMARKFVENVRDAELRGLDPQLIARLLQQGPEQAGPLLDTIVSDHSGRMIDLANTNEKVLRRIGAQAIRYAQFVNRAINAPLEDQDRLARELPKALRLQDALRSMPAPATGAWLAEQLGMTPQQIRRLAEDFGITLPKFVQHTLNQHPVHVKVNLDLPPGHMRGGVFVPRGAAEGWHVQGPGTSTSDSILARVSNGEFVVKAAAVNYYGADRFHALNRMRLPRFADGGQVGMARPILGSTSPMVIVQPVTVPQSVQHVTRIDRASFDDARALDTFQRRQRSRALVQR